MIEWNKFSNMFSILWLFFGWDFYINDGFFHVSISILVYTSCATHSEIYYVKAVNYILFVFYFSPRLYLKNSSELL